MVFCVCIHVYKAVKKSERIIELTKKDISAMSTQIQDMEATLGSLREQLQQKEPLSAHAQELENKIEDFEIKLETQKESLALTEAKHAKEQKNLLDIHTGKANIENIKSVFVRFAISTSICPFPV